MSSTIKIPRQDITLTHLPNGLRLVHRLTPKARTGIFGVAVRAGSADEMPGEFGLAHFVEHTIFKGTERRSSWHIINRMEAVGGELNAFTTKEETVVYSIFPSGAAARAAELIADLVRNSRFPDKELEKERNVVADEIDSYLDSPADAVFDDFEDLLFAGRGVGHNILGSRHTLDSFNSQSCSRWLHRFYVPENMVVFYSGAQSADRIATLTEKYFGSMTSVGTPVRPETGSSIGTGAAFSRHKAIDSHQTHCVTGIEVPGLYSDTRHAVALLANLTGGPGMNSLLNVALRERRGLVYSVETSTSMFTDCGMMAVYFGCDPEDTSRCAELTREVFRHIASGKLSDSRIEKAKKQYIGQIILASDNRESNILTAARTTLFRGKPSNLESTAEAIKAVRSYELQTLAEEFSERCCSLTLGPEIV